MNLFQKRIRSAIQDEVLQAALDKNADQRLVARELAYTGLDDNFHVLKEQTHAIRMDVLQNLDAYLDEFSQKARQNGFIVHFALDAEEASRIILEIAKRKDARLISKSKSMVSEEIQLNSTLEAAGLRVVETDLGEYIVQLREEHPSHIITPAVHLRREEVGETFHQKLGIPFTNDIQELTNFARTRLRQIFLDTDIGISGVNMGIVANGSICILTNEGNGRMVTTLPNVHIALMGIERLVPDMEALSLIVKLLPRSATGQKITVYTQIIRGPRRSNEVDGAQERHIVLVDNGRSSIRKTQLEEILLCIRCGACINACPIFREIGGFSYISKKGVYTPYPGPIGSVLSPALFGQEEFGHLAQASSLCGACKEVCPVNIDLPTLLLRIRAGEVEPINHARDKSKPLGLSFPLILGLKIFTWFSSKPKFFGLSQRVIGSISKVLSRQRSWMKLPTFTGWGYSKDFPRPAVSPFRDQWKQFVGMNERDSKGKNNSFIKKRVVDGSPTNDRVEDSLISQFKEEFVALNGNLVESDQQSLSSQIMALLKEKEVDQLMAWEADHLPESLINDLKRKGIQVDFEPNPDIKIGLTGANAAISETGTIVLTTGFGRPGSISLLPDVHIAILHQQDIYNNLSEVLQIPEIQNASSAVLISGPSRTADIEMTLTIGVHGPKEIHIFLMKDK